MANPFQIADGISVTAWDLDSLTYVLDGTVAVEVHVSVADHDLDELLARVAGGVVLKAGEPPYDLTVIRGGQVLGYVHRRPGLPSTYTNRLRSSGLDFLGLLGPLPS